MKSVAKVRTKRFERHKFRLRQRAGDSLRLSVFRSLKNIYAQIIDDKKGVTLCSASTLEESLKSGDKVNKVKSAQLVGKLIGTRAIDLGIKKLVFDTGRFAYHGRVKALAESARETGLEF